MSHENTPADILRRHGLSPADPHDLDLPNDGDRFRIRLTLRALDGTLVEPGTIATFDHRIDKPGLGPLWNMLRTDDDRLVPVLIDPISVDKLDPDEPAP